MSFFNKFKFINICIGLLCVLAVGQSARADDVHAPFGLTWGMSTSDAKKLGINLTPVPGDSEYGTIYAAVNLPKVIADMDTCLLSFGYEDRLARIVAVGKEVNNDPSGGQVISRYRELATNLGDLYGKGSEIDQRDTELFKAPNQYLESLQDGRAHRYTTFKNDGTTVELSVRASSMDTARYAIIFESIPEMKILDTDKKKKEKDAL